MEGHTIREGRRKRHWTQVRAARAFGVTQAYLSMIESGRRPPSAPLVRKAFRLFDLPPTVLPLQMGAALLHTPLPKDDFSQALAHLGYPGFAYLKSEKKSRKHLNPAQVLLEALNRPDLDARVAEGLPWLAMTYVDMDWCWLMRNAKLQDRQNRLGFALSLGREVALGRRDSQLETDLGLHMEVLEKSRLAREDTFCHDSMTQAEKVWLRKHRSAAAAHWNLLTDLTGEHLAYATR